MAFSCPRCQLSFEEDELPRLSEAARVLCPQCQEPMTLPEMTIPISIASASPQAIAGLDPAKKYALLVLTGQEAGRVVEVEQPALTIGRAACDVLLDDPEISRQHVRVAIEGEMVLVEDLGSTNGTFVGDERIGQATLGNREKFRVGSHEIAFVVTDRDG